MSSSGQSEAAVTEATLDACVDDALIAAQAVCNLPATSLTYVIENLESPQMPLKAQELLEAVGQMAGWLLRGEGPGDPGDAEAEERDVTVMQMEHDNDGRTPLEILSQRCVTGADIAQMLVPMAMRKKYSSLQLRIYTNALGPRDRPASASEIASLVPLNATMVEKDGCRRAMVSLRAWAVSLGSYFLTLEHLMEEEAAAKKRKMVMANQMNNKKRSPGGDYIGGGGDEEENEPSWAAGLRKSKAKKALQQTQSETTAAAQAATERELLQRQSLESALAQLEACKEELEVCRGELNGAKHQLIDANHNLHATRAELEAQSGDQRQDLAQAIQGNERLTTLLQHSEHALQATKENLSHTQKSARQAQDELDSRTREFEREMRENRVQLLNAQAGQREAQSADRLQHDLARTMADNERLSLLLRQCDHDQAATNENLAHSQATTMQTAQAAKRAQDELEARTRQFQREMGDLCADYEEKLNAQSGNNDEERRALLKAERLKSDAEWRMTIREVEANCSTLEAENEALKAEMRNLRVSNRSLTEKVQYQDRELAAMAEAASLGSGPSFGHMKSINQVNVATQTFDWEDDTAHLAGGGRKALPSRGARKSAGPIRAVSITPEEEEEEEELVCEKPTPADGTGDWESGWTSRRTVKQVKEDQYAQTLAELKQELPKKKGYPLMVGGRSRPTTPSTSPDFRTSAPTAAEQQQYQHHIDVNPPITQQQLLTVNNSAGGGDEAGGGGGNHQPKKPLKSSLKSRSTSRTPSSSSAGNNTSDMSTSYKTPQENTGRTSSSSSNKPPVSAGMSHLGWGSTGGRDPRVENFIQSLTTGPVSAVDLGDTLPWLTNLSAVSDALVRYQRNSLIHLDIRGCNKLSDDSVPLLVKIIKEIPSLRNIDFASENFTVEGEKELAVALAERTEQRVVQCAVDDISSGNVMCVSLRNKALTDSGVQIITDAIEELSDRHDDDPDKAPHLVRTLDVRDNDLTEGLGAKCLLRLLQLGQYPNKSGVVTVLADGNPQLGATTLNTIHKLSSLRKQNYLVNGDPVGGGGEAPTSRSSSSHS